MIVAGTMLLISCASVFLMASALTACGTTVTMHRLLIICFTHMEMACLGTSSMVANQPSPTCCLRQRSSSVTTL